MRTRIAPTPSGYIHQGNLLNFALIQAMADSHNWQIHLRIDDFDQARTRWAYVEDIFKKLRDLDIHIDSGPSTAQELQVKHSQLLNKNIYWDALSEMRKTSNLIFVCRCSRTQLVDRKCVQDCQQSNLLFTTGESLIRIQLANQDEVLWRREDLPAYHLIDVIEDELKEITHVVRGVDLFESTQIQSAIRKIFQIAEPRYLFHPLVLDSNGLKLSKSQGTSELPLNLELAQWLQNKVRARLPGLERQLLSPIELGLDQAAPTDDLLG